MEKYRKEFDSSPVSSWHILASQLASSLSPRAPSRVKFQQSLKNSAKQYVICYIYMCVILSLFFVGLTSHSLLCLSFSSSLTISFLLSTPVSLSTPQHIKSWPPQNISVEDLTNVVLPLPPRQTIISLVSRFDTPDFMQPSDPAAVHEQLVSKFKPLDLDALIESTFFFFFFFFFFS